MLRPGANPLLALLAATRIYPGVDALSIHNEWSCTNVAIPGSAPPKLASSPALSGWHVQGTVANDPPIPGGYPCDCTVHGGTCTYLTVGGTYGDFDAHWFAKCSLWADAYQCCNIVLSSKTQGDSGCVQG